jgi:hypothetical protein
MKDDNHTVSYKSIDYYSMCEKSKEKIKKMQEMGGTYAPLTLKTSQRT